MSHKFIHDSESKDSMYDYLEISLLRSVVVPDPLRKTVISAEVSRLFRILDMKSGSTVGGWTTDAVEVNCLLFLQPNVLPKSAKVPRLCVSAAVTFWDWFLLLLLPGWDIPQSLNNSDNWASELRRRLEVVWEALDKSSADSMVVICAHELRRPTSLPRRPRIISCIKEMENGNFRDVVCTSHRKETLSTVFENHRKSLIQHSERSELRLHFEWTKVNQKCKKWSILMSFWKPEACGQTVLPDRSVLIGK